MDGKYVELTVVLPVTQYVRVEAAAAEGSRSLKSTASFLLSNWVNATHQRAKACHSDMGGGKPNTVRPSNLDATAALLPPHRTGRSTRKES